MEKNSSTIMLAPKIPTMTPLTPIQYSRLPHFRKASQACPSYSSFKKNSSISMILWQASSDLILKTHTTLTYPLLLKCFWAINRLWLKLILSTSILWGRLRTIMMEDTAFLQWRKSFHLKENTLTRNFTLPTENLENISVTPILGM